MRRTPSASRWTAPTQPYRGGWRQNPWINAVFRASQARGATDDVQERQQKAAMRTWENEGGSLATHPSIGR